MKPFRTIILASLLGALCSATAADQTSDERALGALIERYLAAHSARDLGAWLALWSARSPDLERRRRLTEQSFASPAVVTFTAPRVSRQRIDGDRAQLRLSVERHTRIGEQVTITIAMIAFTFVREDGIWRMWQERPAVVALAEALLGAPGAEARVALLASEDELINPELARWLAGQGDRAYAQGDYARARVAYELVLNIAERRSLRAEMAGAWHNLGNLAYLRRDYAAALEYYEKSLAPLADLNRRFDLASTLASIALIHAVRGDAPTSIAWYERSLAISEELEDRTGASETLEKIGRLHADQGDYGRASEVYRRALAYREALRDRGALARLLLNLAGVEYDQGEAAQALHYYSRALPTLATLESKEGLIHTLHTIANIDYLQGDYSRALVAYERTRREAASAHNALAEASALSGIGLVHALGGDFLSSLSAYERSLALWEGQANLRETAAALQKVGAAHFQLGDFDRALAHYERALAVREALREPEETGWALLDVGLAQAGRRDFAAAIAVAERARAVFEEARRPAGVIAALIAMSGMRYAEGGYAAAVELAARASQLAQLNRETEFYWQARHRAGRAQYRLNQFAAASQSFADAIAAIEAPRTTEGDERTSRAFELKTAPYLAMVDLLVARGRTSDAFHFAERARARALRFSLGGVRARITKGMTRGEREREAQLLREAAALRTRLYRERTRERPDRSRINDLARRLQRARAAIADFEAQLFAIHPELKIWRGEGASITAEAAGSLLNRLEPRAALLEFVATDENIYLFVLTRGTRGPVAELKTFALNLDRRALAERISAFAKMVRERAPQWERPAGELHGLLLGPASAALAGKTRLVIAPDAELWDLPFAALLSPSGRALIDDHALSLAPSLTSLARRFAQSIQIGGGAGGRIGELLVLDGAEATLERARAVAGGHRWLHFDAPLVLDEASPFFTHVALAPGEGTDGRLETRELLAWDLRADLVAFNGAADGFRMGRAVIGLSRALAIAGSRLALIGGWKVDRPATFRDFYRVLKSGADAAHAWRASVGEMLREGLHPHYWAGFAPISLR
jgi:tetratricopeptide (TPR) repeat protein/CHAT domain-containing protein